MHIIEHFQFCHSRKKWFLELKGLEEKKEIEKVT